MFHALLIFPSPERKVIPFYSELRVEILDAYRAIRRVLPLFQILFQPFLGGRYAFDVRCKKTGHGEAERSHDAGSGGCHHNRCTR